MRSLCRVIHVLIFAHFAGARSPKRAKAAGSAPPRLPGIAPHLLYALRPSPFITEDALLLSLHDFGATTWRPPMATWESLSKAERAYWTDGLANVKAKFERFEPLGDDDLAFYRACRDGYPDRKQSRLQMQRAACGYALAHTLAARGQPAVAAAEYRPVAGVLPLDAQEARMPVADFLNFYLLLIYRAGLRQVYATIFDHVAAKLMPWRHRLQLAQLTMPEVDDPTPAAFHDKALWPKMVTTLEESYPVIRAELEAFLALEGSGDAFGAILEEQFIRAQGSSWDKLVLFEQETEQWNATACNGPFQQTCDAIRMVDEVLTKAAIPDGAGGEMIKRVTGEVGIFKLASNSSLVPHTGSNNLRLTAHLGLVVPEGCQLFVGQDTYSWREGELVVFDDAFVHSVENQNLQRDRYVLLLNFWKPGFCTNFDHRCFV